MFECVELEDISMFQERWKTPLSDIQPIVGTEHNQSMIRQNPGLKDIGGRNSEVSVTLSLLQVLSILAFDSASTVLIVTAHSRVHRGCTDLPLWLTGNWRGSMTEMDLPNFPWVRLIVRDFWSSNRTNFDKRLLSE